MTRRNTGDHRVTLRSRSLPSSSPFTVLNALRPLDVGGVARVLVEFRPVSNLKYDEVDAVPLAASFNAVLNAFVRCSNSASSFASAWTDKEPFPTSISYDSMRHSFIHSFDQLDVDSFLTTTLLMSVTS